MKKIILSAFCALLSAAASAQNVMVVEQKSGATTEFDVDDIQRVYFNKNAEPEDHILPVKLEAVDLGLPSGTLWANMNIGAQMPEEFGLYFAWGETVGYGTDTSDGHSFDSSNYTFNINGVKELSAENDAAIAYWGNDWRTPNYDDGTELLENCVTEWTTQNNVVGMKCTSKINGESIFFPAAGDRYYNSLNGKGTYAVLWLSSICPTKTGLASDLRFLSTIAHVNDNRPFVGQNIRPVKSKRKEADNNICPDSNHPHIIDLGLPSGTKWACCNVGASAPQQYGNYYAWGETEPKNVYNLENYKWGMGILGRLTKYNSAPVYGTVDNKSVLDPEDDAATANWNTPWYTPSETQVKELVNSCTSTWGILDGVNGRIFVGLNGSKIFFPAAGYRWSGELRDTGTHGYYWSSSLNENLPEDSFCLFLYSEKTGRTTADRGNGFTVRSVQ